MFFALKVDADANFAVLNFMMASLVLNRAKGVLEVSLFRWVIGSSFKTYLDMPL